MVNGIPSSSKGFSSLQQSSRFDNSSYDVMRLPRMAALSQESCPDSDIRGKKDFQIMQFSLQSSSQELFMEDAICRISLIRNEFCNVFLLVTFP